VQGKFHPQQDQIYNGLDACLTFEILGELKKLFNEVPLAYNFSRAMQGPAMELMLRGFKVDETERRKAVEHIKGEIEQVNSLLQRYAFAVWGKGLNPRSPDQLKKFFYEEWKLPPVYIAQKGEKRISTNREALEKLELYMQVRPIISCILLLRDLYKQISVFETEVRDGRMYTSYNIAGTETWRWSSSASAWGDGTNIQNIQKDPDDMLRSRRRSLRRMFVADSGWKICGIDLTQAESREVGWICGTLFNDWRYLDACESGDLHTQTCKLIWPGFAWTGDPKKDRDLADQIFYREFSYRDMSKRGGHASNYYGQPPTVARNLKVPTKMIQDFQDKYFTAFPAIPKWHKWTQTQLMTTQSITTPFGFTRTFFGRPNDDSTLREAIAFSPQSSTATRLNLSLWRIWRYMPEVRILCQVHDALYFLYRVEDGEEQIVNKALGYMEVKLEHKGRSFSIPGEAKVGWNWSNFHEKVNPDGLKKFKGKDERKRTSILERVM